MKQIKKIKTKLGLLYRKLLQKLSGRKTQEPPTDIDKQYFKKGIVYHLLSVYGIEIHKSARSFIEHSISQETKKLGRELDANEGVAHFVKTFVNINSPIKIISVTVNESEDAHFNPTRRVYIALTVSKDNEEPIIIANTGSGPINAALEAFNQKGWCDCTLEDYNQHPIQLGSNSGSVAYVKLQHKNGSQFFGWGIDNSSGRAIMYALASAINQSLKI
jgi:2-isopropylmalate synthase